MQFSEKQHAAVLAGLRLLQASLYGGLVRHNDGEIGDILTDSGTHEGLAADEIDSLCEELQIENADDTIVVDLNIYDDEGNVVDGTTADLTVSQISDIVDHASQLILVRRTNRGISGILDELEEALVAADVIEAE